MTVAKIYLKTFDPNELGTAEFHSFVVPRALGYYIHSQDFFEVMYITEGEGEHWLNGKTFPLTAGQLCFVTPRDVHDFILPDDQKLYFININFSARLWMDYCRLAQLDPYQPGNVSAAHGAAVTLASAQREQCKAVFHQYMALFQTSLSPFTLCRFWSAFLPYLLGQGAEDTNVSNYPPWLFNAMRDMEDYQNLAGGLARFIELSTVSVPHLTRVLKATTGMTPSEYVNGLRLKRAARLLATTSDHVTTISANSGFESLSYFHRLFLKHYGKTPRAYRLQVKR